MMRSERSESEACDYVFHMMSSRSKIHKSIATEITRQLVRTILQWDFTKFRKHIWPVHQVLQELGTLLRPDDLVSESTVIAATDTSATNHGGSFQTLTKSFHDNPVIIARSDKGSSTLGELRGVLLLLQQCIHLWTDRTVIFFLDNFAGVRIMCKGSAKPELQAVATEIFRLCQLHKVSFLPVWRRRDSKIISLCDAWSRVEEHCDYRLQRKWIQWCFRLGLKLWNHEPHIDRFASAFNKVVARFNSRFFYKGSEGDALAATDWHRLINWCFPPFRLVPWVVHTLKRARARAILIGPWDPSSRGHFSVTQASYVRHAVRIQMGPRVLVAFTGAQWRPFAKLRTELLVSFIDFTDTPGPTIRPQDDEFPTKASWVFSHTPYHR